MDLKEYTKQKNELGKRMAVHGKKMLKTVFTEFFDATPEVEAINWTQYTPHFNDGEVCRFSTNTMCVKFKKPVQVIGYDGVPVLSTDIDDDGYTDAGFVESYALDIDRNKNSVDRDIIHRASKNLDKLEKEFSGADDVFQTTFGDGVKVIATRNGFDVEDYDHD